MGITPETIRKTFQQGETRSLPLKVENTGHTVGSALVSFQNGLWRATLLLTDEGAKELGFELIVEPFPGVDDEMALVARPHEDVQLVAELRAKWTEKKQGRKPAAEQTYPHVLDGLK